MTTTREPCAVTPLGPHTFTRQSLVCLTRRRLPSQCDQVAVNGETVNQRFRNGGMRFGHAHCDVVIGNRLIARWCLGAWRNAVFDWPSLLVRGCAMSVTANSFPSSRLNHCGLFRVRLLMVFLTQLSFNCRRLTLSRYPPTRHAGDMGQMSVCVPRYQYDTHVHLFACTSEPDENV